VLSLTLAWIEPALWFKYGEIKGVVISATKAFDGEENESFSFLVFYVVDLSRFTVFFCIGI